MTSTPLTDLRDDNNSDWHRWAERNPDAYVEHSKARGDRMQSETTGKKVRLCKFVSDDGVPCLREHTALGYCMTHYMQVRRGDEPAPIRGAVRVCSYVSPGGEPCDARHHARGYCRSHYRQLLEGGNLKPRRRYRRGSESGEAPAGSRNGEPWAEWEFQALMAERPLIEIALELGRTYAACAQARRRRLKMLGLHRPRIKTEQDPYDGSVVSLRPERRNE